MKKMLFCFALLFALAPLISSCTSNTDVPEVSDGVESGSEKEIIINPGEWELPGTLTMPDGEGPFALVVFVHGSGPSDRDETMGKQKVFKDLASDLAKIGIASIRYDKRTYVYGTEMAADTRLTVKEETIDDAIYAAEFAQTIENIKPDSVFIAGHSMGGYLVPRIDEADTENTVAGYILLAGSVRSMTELIIEQIDYILSVNPTMSIVEKAAYKKEYADAVEAVNALTEADLGSDKALLGAYPAYWLDLADYKPAEMILNVKEPLLILQGGNDYQVTTTDYDLWKSALTNNANAQFILYPNLTHAFTETDKKGVPDDYNVYKKIDGKVADDIKNFIENVRAK